MSKFKYYLIHISLMIQTILWIILGFAILYFLDMGDPNSPVYGIILKVFIVLTVLLVIEFILSFKTNLGKQYWITYGRRTYAASFMKQKKQHLDELKDYNYSILPEYNGKNIFAVRSTGFILWMSIFLGIITIVLVVWAIVDKECIMLPFWAMFMGALALGAWEYLSTKVMFDATGAHLIKKDVVSKTIKWDKVKSIGISPNMLGYSSIFGFMYISTRTIKNKVFDEYVEKNYLILMKPRPKVIHCLLKHWDKEIVNLDTKKNWLKYIKNL